MGDGHGVGGLWNGELAGDHADRPFVLQDDDAVPPCCPRAAPGRDGHASLPALALWRGALALATRSAGVEASNSRSPLHI